MTSATLSDNVTQARSGAGSAEVLGGGVFTNTLLTLDHVVVGDNTARASGLGATAQGGGIWNGDLIAGPPVLGSRSPAWLETRFKRGHRVTPGQRAGARVRASVSVAPPGSTPWSAHRP